MILEEEDTEEKTQRMWKRKRKTGLLDLTKLLVAAAAVMDAVFRRVSSWNPPKLL